MFWRTQRDGADNQSFNVGFETVNDFVFCPDGGCSVGVMLAQCLHGGNNRSFSPRTHFGNEPTDFVDGLVTMAGNGVLSSH